MAGAHVLGQRGDAPAVQRIGAGAATVFVQVIKLDTALDNKEIAIPGDVLAAIEGTPGAKINVRFNLSGGGLIPFRVGARMNIPFDRIFVTSEAQPLKSITLLSSRGALDVGSGIVTVETDPVQVFRFFPTLTGASPSFRIFDREVPFSEVTAGSTLGQITGERVKKIKIFFPERHLSAPVNGQLNIMGTLSGGGAGNLYHSLRPGETAELDVTDLQDQSTNVGLQIQRDPASVTLTLTALVLKTFTVA